MPVVPLELEAGRYGKILEVGRAEYLVLVTPDCWT